jgi:aerobic carbon-monoxide dehydrogenase medium subunit
MPWFEFAEPGSLREALGLLDRDDPAVRPIGGGTALMLMMKAKVFQPVRLVSLQRVTPSLEYISTGEDGSSLRIGATTSLAALEKSHEVQAHFPVVIRTLRTLANVRVRNVATVGGNIAHADPHLDLPPVWIALGATVEINSLTNAHSIPIEDFFTGYYETILHHNELITAIQLPKCGWRATYAKVTTRAIHDWPVLGIAVALRLSDTLIVDARIGIGAATEKPMRLKTVEDVLRGAPMNEATARHAGDVAVEAIELHTDNLGSAQYKRHLLRVHMVREILRASKEAPYG